MSGVSDLDSEFPSNGFYDKNYPFVVAKKVIIFDGKKSTIKTRIFQQISFSYCLYNSVDTLERISYRPIEENKVIHVFGNPHSVIVEDNSQYILAIVLPLGINSETEEEYRYKLIEEYLNNLTSEMNTLVKKIEKKKQSLVSLQIVLDIMKKVEG